MSSTNSKYFFLATNTGYYDCGKPTPECIEFYKRRSSTKLNTVIVGNVLTTNGYGTNSQCGRISDHNSWRVLTGVIEQRGSIPGIQLSTTWKQYTGQKSFFNDEWDEYRTRTSAIIKAINIPDQIDDLRKSVIIAKNNGFKHIQLHAAHGYLYSMLIDPNFSSTVNYAIDQLNTISMELKELGIITSIRVSLYCGFDKDVELKRRNAILRLCQGSFDYIDLSEGYYNYDKRLIYPCGADAVYEREKRSISFAEEVHNRNVIISGRKKADQGYPSNVYIGLCRSLIANPSYLEDHIDICNECGRCNYFSRGETKMQCSKW